MPNYDGRRPESHAAEDAALAVPRALLAPVWAVLQAIRYPVSAAAQTPAVYHVFETASGVSTDLSSREAVQSHFAIAPLLSLDAGRRPTIGAEAELRQWLDPRHTLRALFATGGERAFDAEVWDRQRWSNAVVTGLRFVWYERPDVPMYGPVNSDGAPEAERRVWIRRLGGFATLDTFAGSLFGFHVATGLRGTADDLGAAPWLALTQYPQRDDYAAWATDVETSVDTRARGENGVRVALRLHHGIDLDVARRRQWLGTEVWAGAYHELFAPRRVLGIEAVYARVDALDRGAVPFLEVPTLGGGDPMNGFLEGRMRGNHVASAAVVYRWPIWVWLDGVSHLAVGGILHDDAAQSLGDLHASWDIGIRTRRGGLVDGTILFGLGSTRFAAPSFGIERARVLFALTRSF
jgi:hypothetical protein